MNLLRYEFKSEFLQRFCALNSFTQQQLLLSVTHLAGLTFPVVAHVCKE